MDSLIIVKVGLYRSWLAKFHCHPVLVLALQLLRRYLQLSPSSHRDPRGFPTRGFQHSLL